MEEVFDALSTLKNIYLAKKGAITIYIDLLYGKIGVLGQIRTRDSTFAD